MAKTRAQRIDRDRLVDDVRAQLRQWVPEPHDRLCLYWSYFCLRELARRHVRACLQAGDCYWPRIDPAKIDDYPDTEPTQFGFCWDPTSLRSRMSRALGNLPEMHVWVGLPEEQQVVDLTTGYFPDNCKLIVGQDWPGPTPPPYFWGGAGELPELAVYRPVREATLYALTGLERLREAGLLPG